MKRPTLIIIGVALVMMAAAATRAAEGDDSGQFTELSGDITITRAGADTKAALGAKVVEGDVIVTAADGKGTILFKNGSVLKLGPATNVTINKLVYDSEKSMAKMGYELAMGSVMSIVGSVFGNDDSSYEVTTPTAVAGIRGTIFLMDVSVPALRRKPVTTIIGIEGEVAFTGEDGVTRMVGPHAFSATSDSGMASPPIEVDTGAFNEMMDKVTISPTAPSINPISAQKPSTDLNTDALKTREFQAPGVEGQGGRSQGGDTPEAPKTSDVGTGDTPENLIFQEPPPYTQLQFTLIFNF